MNYEYLVQNIKEFTGVSIYVFNEQNEVISSSGELTKQLFEYYEVILKSYERNTKNAYVFSYQDNVYFGIFALRQGEKCFIGPIGSEKLDSSQKLAFFYHLHFKNKEEKIPRYSFSKIVDFVKFVGYVMTGKLVEKVEIEKNYENKLLDEDKELTHYQLNNSIIGKMRLSYQSEYEYFKIIEEGRMDFIEEMEKKQNMITGEEYEKIGTMSKKSDYKQTEYTAVTTIALATRAAIRGNVRPDLAYEYSDLMLQRLTHCKTIGDISNILEIAFKGFTKLVAYNNTKNSQGLLVTQCQDYIFKNLYQKFSIQDMSEDLNVNRGYMSTLFSKEMGITIQQYVREERLKAASNLLKYSEASVNEISEYMHFSSTGRFCGYFKKKYGMTPLEYRKRYKIAEFVSLN